MRTDSSHRGATKGMPTADSAWSPLPVHAPAIDHNLRPAFAEAGNCWTSMEQFSPFNLKRSAGVGVRLYLSMLGFLGIDWGYGFDKVFGTRGGSQLHFVLGQEF